MGYSYLQAKAFFHLGSAASECMALAPNRATLLTGQSLQGQ
jgi:hypothetical protein